ncbi:MAG: YifB family Mg chelatase-like AAA ATPase [Gemmatimonadota bacterium]|nr:YifB family Mg chelatase-like AAA ATPase [Gemmatimonadota bacterium]
MVQKVDTAAVTGLDVRRVKVEVAITRGTPMIQIVGLAQSAVREGRERIRAAVSQIGLHVPGLRITVNLAPADIRKDGSAFDLPITVGILTAAGTIPADRIRGTIIVGELGLDGRLRPIRGALPIALHAGDSTDAERLIVPAENEVEARSAPDLDVIGAATLTEVLDFLRNGARPPQRPRRRAPASRPARNAPDLSSVRGQLAAKRALEIAAAGGHNLLMRGSPGAGKTSLARCLPGILPPLERREAVQVTAIHSVAGTLGPDRGLMVERPFRAPHHSISEAGLVGGGSIPRPGEASLAHCGVLFLDELPEFGRGALESLRQPLEEGAIHLVRAQASATFPARFTLVAAMNPCPCGRLYESGTGCECPPGRVQAYQRRLSGPLLDRIDMHVDVPPVTWGELASPVTESSASVRERVVAAMKARPHIRSDREDPVRDPRLTSESRALLRAAIDRVSLSARGVHRTIRVARTIASLEGTDAIEESAVAEAIRYRAPPAA